MEVKKIQETLKKARPHLSESTLRSYSYNIRRVYTMIESKSFEKESKKIAAKLKDVKASVGRALVNSVIVYEKSHGRKTPKLEELKGRLDTEHTDTIKL